MKIYTKKGDDGKTHILVGDSRVAKHHPRVDLYGIADELNSYIGVALTATGGSAYAQLRGELITQQNLLFELGSELAGYKPDGVPVIRDEDVTALEAAMDRMNDELEPMKAFILPGGTGASAHLHVCRTICRRLERRCVEVMDAHGNKDATGTDIVSATALQYINRLSDYLFVAARYCNHVEGVEDIKWTSRAKGDA